MGRHELEYPTEATNQVKRFSERSAYALRTIHDIVNSTQILHVSFNPPNSPFPMNLPMIGQMGSFDRPSAGTGDPLELYIHGYVSSRVMNLSRDAQGNGMPVCVAASNVDGIVLALSSFSHSYNYRSAVLFGHATLVESEEEKLYALELITNSVVPDRFKNTRQPLTGGEMQSTSVLKVKIASGSAKIRDGGASDEKHDMENQEMLERVWTGVLPIYPVMGEPVPSSYNQADTPAHVSEFVSDFTNDNKEYSLSAARK